MEIKIEGDIKTGWFCEKTKIDQTTCEKTYENFILRYEIWFDENKSISRDDLPAYIYYSENGIMSRQLWMRNGDLYREGDLPSQYIFYETGELKEEKWMESVFNSRRDDKPCLISYYKNGNKKEERWSVDSRRETLDVNGNRLPDAIEYDEFGNFEREVWDDPLFLIGNQII